MKYRDVLEGGKEPLEIYNDILEVLADIQLFPRSIELIYRKAMTFSEEDLDRLRFALLRLQVYSDINRTLDMERAQKIKYVSQVLEKIIFGSLLLEHEEIDHG
jgi:hypothetical protein